jgi:hypothetical protein
MSNDVKRANRATGDSLARARDLRSEIAHAKNVLGSAERELSAIEGRCKHVWKDLPSTIRVIEGGERTDLQGWRPRTFYAPTQRVPVHHRECEACGRQESTEKWKSRPATTEPDWDDDRG